ncbi:hypothetical protein J437_LFUL010900 [Ladona fulva]|uniref:Chromodomain-helicase-DNA-binding protein 7 n=1 Tax=Ladona fulva TaxID=123851 RepID=A0A8K0KB93_LADFU|nr:hypothetical protein J437_LFUL010900 [Ladona fulva]
MIVQHVLAVRMGKREIRKGITKALKEGGEIDSVAKEGETKKEGITEVEEVRSEAQPKEEEKKEDGEIKVEITAVEETDMNQSVAETEVIVKEVKEEAKESLQEQVVEGGSTINAEEAGDVVVEGEQKEEGSKEENEAKKEELKPKETAKEEVDEESDEEDVEVEVVDVEEYFVKYRNFSYLHCEWKTEEELMKGDKRMAAKIKRFKQKMGQNTNIFENLEDEPFNPDYVEVDRVLDVAEHKDPNTGKTTKNYLVKWKGLQYEDATWELEEDIDPSKVEQFEIFRELPPKDQWKPKKKPTGEQWEKLDLSPVYKNDNTLRAYQLEGLNWLLFSWFNGRNCILADEMGLGKTIQSIAFIHAVYQWGIKRPFLVVAPLSTIPNWQREFEAWTDMNVIVYHGSTASRNMLQEYEMFYRDEKGCPMKDLPKFNVLITTFEIIIADCLELREFTWRLCVIDEAHRLKNRNCKLLEGLRLLNLEHRVLLSGTPLQNNVNELFSLLNFLEPSQFGSSESFLQEFGALKSETEVQKLQALLKPMMLRRLKEDVEKTIAPKEETVIEVELTNIQKKYYRAILERNFSFLSKGTTTANVPNLMNTMMELRKCCIHPYLLNGAEEQIQLEYRQTNGEDPDAYFKALIHSSGKMVLIDKLLPKLKANGHRVLVFSQMVRCLDILEDYLMYRKYPFERIDGRIRGNLRQAAIDRYCKPDSDRFVFLLCTKAGGLGINLTAADTVIIYDSDWNPQNDLQAQARCHRIGQQKMVKVYRLLCRNTYEREMFDKASLKLGLDRAVLQSMNTAQGGKDPAGTAIGQKQLSKKEIEDLLKKGAYGAIMEEDNAGDKFCEEDIDQILERRTQVITLETGEKGSTFSKASFASSGIRSDIDIDDPDFWKKWAKRADIDMSEGGEKNELVISEPRRRTQIKRYGHDESMVDMSELDSSSDSDDEAAGRRCQRSSKFGRRPRSLSKYYDGDHIPREGEIVYGSWARSECFKVEKGLLTFGWGRWPEILAQGQFRRGWRESDVEDCARVIVRLSAPVPRGRKGKKKMKEARMLNAMMEVNDWSRNEKYDGDIFLENNYKKHLTRHANKVLLRVRMLYYIKHEIIGDLVQQIAEGVPVNLDEDKISEDEDDCLVVEGGNVPPNAHGGQRQDEHSIHHHANQEHHLTPEETMLRYQQSQNAAMAQGQYSGMSAEHAQHNHNMMAQLGDGSQQDDRENSAGGTWPSVADLNTRLRRVITSYQRNYKKEELKMAQKAKAAAAAAMPDCRRWPQKMDRKEKMEQMLREREKSQLDLSQRRWSRREEQDFYRTVSTFGVEYDRKRGRYDWNRFRTISHLERKYDEAMTEYYKAFLAMCKRSCGLKLLDDEVNYPDMPVEPLPEDKARRCLERIELLRRVREDILSHPRLGERLALCRPSSELPEWWIPGRHDRELVLGAAKHGLGRTDCYILNDPELSFRDFVREGNLRSKEPQTADVSKESEVSTKVSGWNEEGGPKDVLQMEGDEMIVKLEKGEGTLKIERIGGKKEPKVTEEKKAEEVVVKEEVEEVKKEEETVQEEEEKVEEKEVPEPAVKEELAEAEVKAEEDEAEVKTEVKSEEEMEGMEIKGESEVKAEEEFMEAESAVKEEEENVPLDLKAECVKQEVVDEVEKMELEEEPVEQKENVEEKDAIEEKPKSPTPSLKEAVEEIAPQEEREEEPMQVEEEKAVEEEEKGEEKEEVEPKETLESEKEELTKEDGEAKVQEESEPVEEKKEEVTEEKESEEVSEEKAEEKENAVEEAKDEEEKKVEEKEEEKEKEEAKEEEGAKKEEEIVKEKTGEGEAVVGEEENVEEPKKAEAPAPEIEIVPVTEPKQETPKDNEVQCLTVTNQDTAVSSSTSVYWPKDRVLQTRLEQIVHLVEHGEWPANNTSCLLPLQSQSIPTSAQSSIVAMGSSMARLVGGLLGALGNLQAGRGMQGKGLMGEGLMGADVARSLAELKGGVSGLPSSDVVTITTTTADHVTLAPVQRQRQMAVQQSLLPPSLSGMGRRGSELQMGRMPGSSSSPVAHQSSMGNLAPPTKKRKRHIAIDVETERAKLHALLNSSANQSSQKMSSIRMQGGMQPPPAHQQQGSTRVLSMPLSSYDLGKYHPSSSQASTPPSDSQAGGTTTPLIKSIGPTTIIPGTSSTLTPIDLSSGLPKVDSGTKNSSEAQDFSMSSKSKQKSKLDDMLDKLMKRKVCVEEPAGKEKKRRKLDEIVLGLSAAKEQSLFSDVKKSGTSITPIPLPASHSSQGRSRHGTSSPHQQQQQPASSKPFTITVTSVPPSQSRPSPQGSMHNQPPKCQRPPAPGRPPSSGHPQTSQSNPLLQQQQQQQRMEQSSQMRSSQSSTAQQMLQQQQQNQRKSVYESMLADLGKVADFSRMGSYSHEAKVNKWLAEQTSMLPERSHSSMGQHSSGSSSAAQVVDLQSSMRRRRPRIDPSLLDWKKLSGEENISVINRVTGKKISGTKAPQLKSLGAWLVENPMFDIDPKWADLVKERGNLPRDLQKRLPPGITVATPGTSSSPTNSGDQRKKGPGRPMSSSHSQGVPTSSSGFPASSAPSSVTTTPSLSTLAAGLSNLNPALLSGLGLGAFDPKNNPLLMPFTRGTGSNSAASALPSLGNMGALAGLGGLGGVSNLSLANSLFANLAGLNLPSMDSSSQSESRGNSSGGTSGTSSNKNRKSEGSKGNSTPNIPTSSAFPFFFPNPSLLYNPLGLGGLNPFSLQPGMNPAYDTLAQQCRLLNGVSTSTSTPTSNTTSTTSSSAGRPSSSQNSRGRPSLASNHRHRPRDAKEALEKQQRHLQRLLNAQGLGQWSGDLELSEATEGSSAGKNGEVPSKTEQEVSEERTGKQAANAAEGGPSPNDASEDCGESPSQSTQRAKVPAGAGTGGSAAKRPRPTRLEETVSKLKESVVEKKSSKSASEEGKGEGPHSPSASGGEEEKEA